MEKLALSVIVALSPLIAMAQATQMNRGDFFPIVNRASDATNAGSYRSGTTHRRFADGVATVEWIQTKEALNLETYRLVQKENENVIEVVSVGPKNYQRENTGPWREVGTPEGVYLFRAIGGPHTSEYYSEEATLKGVKYKVLTWYVKELSGQFSESKTYIAPDGKIFREESRGGALDPKTILWDEVVEFVYDTGPIKIVAPTIPKARSAAQGGKASGK